MERIENIAELEDADVEALFKARAQEALSSMAVPKFAAGGLEFARSDKEIAKCIGMAEHAEHKKTLRQRDRESNKVDQETESGAAGNGAGKVKKERKGKEHLRMITQPRTHDRKGKAGKRNAKKSRR